MEFQFSKEKLKMNCCLELSIVFPYQKQEKVKIKSKL